MNLQEQCHKDQNRTDGVYNLYIWKISFILDINLHTLDQRLEEVISPFSDRRDRKPATAAACSALTLSSSAFRSGPTLQIGVQKLNVESFKYWPKNSWF